jgi:hypothetical protein
VFYFQFIEPISEESEEEIIDTEPEPVQAELTGCDIHVMMGVKKGLYSGKNLLSALKGRIHTAKSNVSSQQKRQKKKFNALEIRYDFSLHL